MATHYLEVMLMSGRDWTSRGWHQKGAGMPGDPFVISGPEAALAMSEDFARTRAGLYRGMKHRARILQAQSRAELDRATIVVDWDQSLLPENQDLSLANAHQTSVYRETVDGITLEIPLVYNRATRTFYAKFSTSTDARDPADISVAGQTPEEVFKRIVTNPHWRQYLDRFIVDDSFLRQQTAAPVVPPDTPTITLELGRYGTKIIGARPGSARRPT